MTGTHSISPVVVACCLALNACDNSAPVISRRAADSSAPAVGTATWVVDQFYAQSAFPDEQEHIAGEFKEKYGSGASLGSQLRPGTTVSIRPIRQTADSAIFATTLKSPGRVSEWYTYLVQTGGIWKIHSIRSMQFSHAYYALVDSVRRGWVILDASPGFRGSLELGAGTDSMLKAHLRVHVATLDSIAHAYQPATMGPAVDIASQILPRSGPRSTRSNRHMRDIQRMLGAVNASSVYSDSLHPSCVFVRVTGEGVAQEGFIKALPGCVVPSIDPRRFIYVEPVLGDWYVYKAQ